MHYVHPLPSVLLVSPPPNPLPQVAMVKAKPALPAEDPSTCPHELLTLLDDCLSFNPRERPSSGEVMKLCAHMMRTYLPGAY